MNNLFPAIVTCSALATSSFTVFAATPAQIAQAQQLLNEGKPQLALNLLEAAHDPTTSSTQKLFLMGISAKLSGDLTKSERYFRDALSKEPSAGRIRLELAEVLYRQGKLDASRTELVAVRNMNPPEQVRENIDNFIAQVDATMANPNMQATSAQKNWGAYVTVGFTSDSNVNAGPSTDTVFLYGLPFSLTADAKETQDTAFFFRTGINHQTKLNDSTFWQSSINASFINHFSSDTYDTTSISASSGPSIKINEKAGLSVPVIYSIQRYNEQDNWYSQSIGIAPRIQYALKKDLQFYLDTSISRKRFNGAGDRDLAAHTFNPSFNYQPIENGNIAFGLQYGREKSGLEIYSNTVRGAYLGYQHQLREFDIQASLTASYTDTQFNGIQAAYTEKRHDISKKLSGSISYTIPTIDGLSLLGIVSYQDNNSNLDINNYERTQFSISLTKRF